MDIQGTENLDTENLNQGNQHLEKPHNNKITNKELSKKEVLFEKSSINLSAPLSKKSKSFVESQSDEDRSIDEYLQEQEAYKNIIMDQVSYPALAEWLGRSNETGYDPDDGYEEADNLVNMMVRAICSRKKYGRICGEEYPREVIKSTLLKANIIHIQNTLMQIDEIDDVQRFESYFISTLFNEVNTYRAKDNHESHWAANAVKRDFGYDI